MTKTVFVLVIAMMTLGAVVPAWADLTPYKFTFSDEYFLRDGIAFSTVFPGATGDSAGGIYQETNTTSHTITRLAGVTTSVPGEYVENTSPNANEFLALNSWGQSLSNGQQVAEVFNQSLNPYLRYNVSGSPTAFTFNSFKLRGTGTLTLNAFDSLTALIPFHTDTLTLGAGFTTFTENWADVYTVQISSGLLNLDQVFMDDVTLNNPVPAVPEPASIALLGTMLFALSVSMRKRRKVG